MKYDKHSSEIELSSGRKVYAYSGRLSVGAEGEYEGKVFYGHDGSFETADWTQAEREEVADAMIARWQAFRAGTRS